jgi:ABC-2 type transport system ATP-binding protein
MFGLDEGLAGIENGRMTSAALKLEGVTKTYRRSHLGRTTSAVGVQELSFSVERGEVFGLLGLNGSGKTTTIKLILGLLRADAGVLEVLGRAMPDRATLARIGYLPEAGYLSRQLTAREDLSLLACLSGLTPAERRARVPRMLEQVGLRRAADRRIGEFSKGMVQRASIAQALIHDPELLLLDEPLSGLDPLATEEMRGLIRWLKERGKTVLLSSHDIAEVARVCDRVAILSRGRLARTARREEWAGSPEKLLALFTEAARTAEGYEGLALS